MLVLAAATEYSILHRQPVPLKPSSRGGQQTTEYGLEAERWTQLNENHYIPLSLAKVLGTCVIVPSTQMSSMTLLGVSDPDQEVTKPGLRSPQWGRPQPVMLEKP